MLCIPTRIFYLNSHQSRVQSSCEYMISIHSSLVGERMSGGSEAMSEHSLLVCLVTGDDEVNPSGYESMAEDLTNSQKKESSAHFSEEEEEEETINPLGQNKSPHVA